MPKLNHNLLSIGQLIEKYYKVVFEDNYYKVFEKSANHHLVENTFMIENRLFPLTLVSTIMYALKKTKNGSWLWYQRYGHFHFQGLTLLHKKDIIRGHLVI